MNQLAIFEDEPPQNQSFFGFEQTGNWADLFGESLRKYANESLPKIKTLSLFSGGGGLDIGFHDAGFEIIEAVEIEQAFVNSLQQNAGQGKYFGTEAKINCIDIKLYKPNFSSIDFIIGGPPCKTFSAAGARAMGVAGTKDERGNLFQEYVRILSLLKPKGFLFENVYRIIGANKGEDLASIKAASAEL